MSKKHEIQWKSNEENGQTLWNLYFCYGLLEKKLVKCIKTTIFSYVLKILQKV